MSPSLQTVTELLIEKFRELRGQAPDAGEPISGLGERDCRSLHGSRYRGVTWYDRENDTVWLLAAHTHREGSRDDSYVVAVELELAGRLYPTAADYANLATDTARTEQTARITEEMRALQELRDRVLLAPGAQRQRYTSQDDLYVEMWAEVEPEVALLILRLRIFRRAAQGLTGQEIETFLTAVYPEGLYQEQGDLDGRFRRFEGYVVPPG